MKVYLSPRASFKTVATYREASEVVRQFIGTRGASQCPRNMGLIYEGGKIVAHVSYNGRVWNAEHGEIPLYDPCSKGGVI